MESEDAVDVFLRHEDAEAALEDAVRDEPGWVGVVSVVPSEPDERDLSAELAQGREQRI